MHVRNSIGRNTSTASHFSTAKKKSAVALAAVAGLGLMAGARSAHADILLWTNAAATNNWDTAIADANWTDVNTSATGQDYTDGSAVQFSDTGPGGTIAVGTGTVSATGVSPASVEFTHGTGVGGNYTFTDSVAGTSGIEGSISLTLDTGYVGTVYLSGQSSITGTATVNGGTLQLTGSAGSTLGTGAIVLGGGNLAFQHGLTAFANNMTATAGTTSGLVANASGDNIVQTGNLSSSVGATIANTVLNLSGGETYSVNPASGANPLSGFTGTIAWGSTAEVVRLQTIATGDTIGSSTALFDMGSGTGTLEMQNTTGVVLLGALSSSGTGAIVTGGSHSGTNTNNQALFVIGGAGLNTTFNGTIQESGERNSIEVTGGGSLTLTNANTYATKTGTAPKYTGAGTTILGNGQQPMNGTISAFLSGAGTASNGGGRLYVSNTTGSATGVSPVYIEGASSAVNSGNGISGGLLGGDGIIQGDVSTVTNGSTNEASDSAPPLANFAAGSIIAPGPAGTECVQHFDTQRRPPVRATGRTWISRWIPPRRLLRMP